MTSDEQTCALLSTKVEAQSHTIEQLHAELHDRATKLAQALARSTEAALHEEVSVEPCVLPDQN
jgi:hypothetical protein